MLSPMAEIYFRIVDNHRSGLAPEQLAKFSRAGTPIVARPDGHQWGAGELHSSEHMIVKIPGMTVEEADRFLDPEEFYGDFILGTGLERPRRYVLDLANLPTAVKNDLSDGVMSPRLRVSVALDKTEALTHLVVNEPIADRRVL